MSKVYIVEHEDGGFARTEEGEEYLSKVVTNLEGNVYSFYDTIEPAVVAAAMARLRRFDGDMRDLILKEFSGRSGQEAAMLRRVLTQFGDDSVSQLSYVPFVVENASDLLLKQLEWNRWAAHVERSPGAVQYDKKQKGEYRYFTPNLPFTLQRQYRQTMDTIFNNYGQVVQKMNEWFQTHDTTPAAKRDVAWRIALRKKASGTARGLLPTAMTSSVGIVGPAQAIRVLIIHLLASDLPEARVAGEQILKEVRQQHGVFFEHVDMPEVQSSKAAYFTQTHQRIEAVSQRYRHQKLATGAPGATLLSYAPHDELELLPHIMFAHSNFSFAELQAKVAELPQKEQSAIFDLFIGERANRRQRPGRPLEVARYTFEIISDYSAFHSLHQYRVVDALEWQDLQPYLGYEVPATIAEAELSALYAQTHHLSQELYETLHKGGFVAEAQYATLLDERMRWKITLNARAALELIERYTHPASPANCRRIASAMHEEIAKVHPRVAAAMLFANNIAEEDSAEKFAAQAAQVQKALKTLGIEEG